MAFLNKESVLFERGEDGKLLPVHIVLETLPDKPSIKAIPLTRGKLQEIFAVKETTKDQDEEIIINNCYQPKFNKEDITVMKSNVSTAIVKGILSLSLGVEQTLIGDNVQAVKQQEKKLDPTILD